VGQFWALREVSFSVARGQMLGVIGKNGSGKSTLLRIIGGVGRPDEGTVETNGRIGALLELGTGFHPDLTGRENVFLQGVISGLTRREVRQRFDEIVAFAEIEDFIDNPVRTYSSGMRMRLAFAVAVHTDPDILLIDEVLAVGDLAFRRKCLDRIDGFRREGRTIVLVSHDTSQVKKLCDEALWLHAGKVVAHGKPEKVIRSYVAEANSETQQQTKTARLHDDSTNGGIQYEKNRMGLKELEIIGVRLLSADGTTITTLERGEPLSIEIDYVASHPIEAPIFGIGIYRDDHQLCFRTNTAAKGLVLSTIQGPGRLTLHLDRLDLVGGQYFVNVGAYEQKWTHTYDYHWNVHKLLIHPSAGDKKGILCPPHYWEVSDALALQVVEAR
jgi:lipopolysaccharide transport system ATP-binding protein